MHAGERLRLFAETKYVQTRGPISALAKAIEMSPSNLQKYLKSGLLPEGRGAGATVMPRLAAIGCNINWLITGVGMMFAPTPEDMEGQGPFDPTRPAHVSEPIARMRTMRAEWMRRAEIELRELRAKLEAAVGEERAPLLERLVTLLEQRAEMLVQENLYLLGQIDVYEGMLGVPKDART